MVMRWGMSDKVGNIDYQEAAEGYQGGSAGGFSVSAATKELIEDEVKAIIDEGYQTARQILIDHNEEFERLAQGLLEYETLTGDEITKVINGLPIDHEDDDDKDAPDQGGKASLAVIPKTKKQKPPKGDPGMEPEPSA
jgi:cell division protease FtsH